MRLARKLKVSTDMTEYKENFFLLILVLAPEVLAGRCPHPCDECTKKQIRKVMTELSQRFPREFQEMMTRLRG